MSSHHPRTGSSATPSPQPPPSDESSSQSQSQSQAQPLANKRSRLLGRPHTSPLAEEDQPGLEVYNPPDGSDIPRHVRVGRPRVRARPGTAPSFWSKEVADNPSQFTFYRDPTPTPPEYREREKDEGYVGGSRAPLPPRPGRSSTVALETALAIPPPDPKRRSHRRDTICGLTRRMFWLAVIAILLLVLGIAVGVGVGVGAGKKSIQSPAPATSSSSTPITTTTPTSSPSPSSSSHPPSSTTASSSASPIPTAATDCPFINNTIYQLPGSTLSFLRLCGIDYSGDGEALELANKPTFSFADCIGNCAGTWGCTGCAWGIVSADEGANHQCWMKGDLKTGHKVADDWCFAILQQ